MTEISVTRALAELKMLGERITTAVNNFSPTYAARGRDTKKVIPGTNLSPEAAIEKIKTSYQSIKDMIERRNRLKAAVMKSNAVTVVTIGGVAMTVADAIERKRSIVFDEHVLARMRAVYAQSLMAVETHNRKLGEQIDQAVLAAYNNEKGKVTPEQYEAVASPRKAEHEMSLIDPLKLDERIQSMTEAIEGFETEVDFVLSESNARTIITID